MTLPNGERASEALKSALLSAAGTSEARLGAANPYGQPYIVDFDLIRSGETVRVRSTWILRTEKTYRARWVALLEDVPGEQLVRGQVGTVVEQWASGVCKGRVRQEPQDGK